MDWGEAADNDPLGSACEFAKLTSADGRIFYARGEVQWPSTDRSDDALESARMTVTLTDGESAWASDLDAQALGASVPNRMRHAAEALTALRAPTEAYTFRLAEHAETGDLDVRVEWDARRHGKDVSPSLHFVAARLADPGPAIAAVLASMVSAADALALLASALAGECGAAAAAAGGDAARLEAAAGAREEARAREAAVGAALTAAKRERLVGLRSQ